MLDSSIQHSGGHEAALLRYQARLGFVFVSITLVGLVIGLAATLAGLAHSFSLIPFGYLFAAFALSAIAVVGGGLWCLAAHTPKTDLMFVALVVTLCLASRIAIIFLLPNSQLTGDELYLHRFVIALADRGLTPQTLAALSSQYDYTIWLSRAFPFYYPIRLLFGNADVTAIQVLNAVLGAGTLIPVFFIARGSVGSRYARTATWLLAVFPYHGIGALSYDPQIPGTFFFVLGVLLILRIVGGHDRKGGWDSTLTGAGLGLCMLLAGIQRGGVDLLLAAVFLLGVTYSWPDRKRPIQMRSVMMTIIAVAMFWLPAKYEFNTWINSHDTHKLRSQVLGFMTRGWNPVSQGEYLQTYEQLDIASAPSEKTKVLETLLATQVARQPWMTLAIVPIVKTGKFFAVGYAPFAAAGLAKGGYQKVGIWSKALSVTYAPLFLLFTVIGMAAVLNRRRISVPILVLISIVLFAAGAIVLVWETSPRYSHSVHFVLAIFAAVGLGSARGKGLHQFGLFHCGKLRRVGIVVAALIVLWTAFSVTLYLLVSHASSHLFKDMRQATILLNGKRIEETPLHPATRAWEAGIVIPSDTSFPAKLRVTWPKKSVAIHQQIGMSAWIPNSTAGTGLCRLIVPSCAADNSADRVEDLEKMQRGCWQDLAGSSNAVSVDLTLLPPEGQHIWVSEREFKLALGYALHESSNAHEH